MQITQDFFFLLFFFDFFLVGFVGVYAFYTYYKNRVDMKKIQLDSIEKAGKIMDEAGKKSSEVINKVEIKANEILNHSELFKSDLNKNFHETLMKLAEENSKKFTAEYEKIMTAVKDQTILQSKQAIDNIQHQIQKQIEVVSAGFNEEAKKSLEKAHQEVEMYKVKELAKIDGKIDQFVIDLGKDLLRINLSPKDHKKLVIQALDKAKEQGLFFL